VPILSPTTIYGVAQGLFVNPSRQDGMASRTVESVRVTYAGFEGEAHGGLTRPSCSRVTSQYPKGTEIRNVRQLAVLSVEELSEIAAAMGLDMLAPDWIGTNLVLEGIPQLTQVPPSSRLVFDGGVSLVVDMENAPCKYSAEASEAHRPGQGMSFVKHARGRRGVTAWVEREGEIMIGERCRLHVPPQRVYAPLAG